jgi:hypothetical protein
MSSRNLTTADESLGYNLSSDERYLITNYITQYNQTNNQINHLYTVLDELRHNIATIYNNSRQLDNMRSMTGGERNPRNNINMSINSGRTSYNLSDYINNLYREINTPVESSVTPLSQEEIAEFTLTQPFSSFENPINSECPIRLEDFLENDTVTQIKKCGHIFNSAELTNWFRNNVKCPVCRGDVITTAPASNSGPIAPAPATTSARTRQRFRTESRSDTRSSLYNFDNLFDFVFRNIDVSNNIIPSRNNTSGSGSSSIQNNNGNNNLHENSSRY